MRCAIIIVSHNTIAFTKLCVLSILKYSATSRLLVIDNGSTDGSLRMLQMMADNGKLHLMQRNVQMHSTQHGLAIDTVRHHLPNEDYILLLDSDAYAVSDRFDIELIKMISGFDLFGVGHFRDAKCIHPSTMLIRKSVFIDIQTSFKTQSIGGKFYDTGMLFCEHARKAGYKLSSISADKMSSLVRHRWCGTRVSRAKMRGHRRLDDFKIDQYDKLTTEWLNDEKAREILASESMLI